MFWYFGGESADPPTADMVDIPPLIEQNKEKINELKKLTAKRISHVTNFRLKDQFYLLRYIMSYKGDVKKAAEAVIKAFEWRKSNSDFVKKAMNADHHTQKIEFPDHMKPYLRAIRKYLAAWGHKSTKNGQPVVICRMEAFNFAALVQVVPSDIIQDYILFSNEVEYWECDQLSRKTGKLHKAYRIIDLKKLPLKSMDRSFLTSFSNSSIIAEYLHPQLVGKTILVNSPTLIKFVFELVKGIGVSKRALEKFYVSRAYSSFDSISEDIAAIVDIKDVPTFLGGQCKCPNGCIPGLPNELPKPTNQKLSKEISEEMEHINTSLSEASNMSQVSDDAQINDFRVYLESSMEYDDIFMDEITVVDKSNGYQTSASATK